MKRSGGVVSFLPDRGSDAPLAASFERLMADDYAVRPVIQESVASDWPGDVAGRLLLSLTRLWRSGYPTEERARSLFAAMLEAVNPSGYFGAELGDVVDEQQLACQGWVVSGLLQHFHLSGDPQAKAAALRIVDALMLPALGRLDTYPRDRSVEEAGAPSGTLTAEADGWLLSSDTWCVFLALNGLVPAFAATRRGDIRGAIERLRDLLATTDVRAQRAQLHAVLTAARNLAQFAEETDDPVSRNLAAKLYDEYAQHGRTLNFATWNWFGRSDSWTEPCAITDSVGLALSLWRLTGQERYLADAELIELNGLAFAQRADGSFGLDSVATDEHPLLVPIERDARWCCTMRGAVGLLEARDGSVTFDEGSRTLTVLSVRPGLIRVSTDSGVWTLQATVEGDGGTRAQLTVVEAPASGSLRLVLRQPGWAAAPDPGEHDSGRWETAEVPAQVGHAVTLDLTPRLGQQLLPSGRRSYFLGPHLLAAVERDEQDGSFPGVESLRPVGQLPNDIAPSGEAPRYRLAFSS